VRSGPIGPMAWSVIENPATEIFRVVGPERSQLLKTKMDTTSKRHFECSESRERTVHAKELRIFHSAPRPIGPIEVVQMMNIPSW
jgi:hypothetical protein